MMALPRISHPQFTTSIPSSGKNVHYRPMLGREEKILLMAKATEGDDADADKVMAVKQIVGNCVTDHDFNVDKATTFDVEWLFVQICRMSLNSVIQVAYRDRDDQTVRTFDVDLGKVIVTKPDKKVDDTGKEIDSKIIDCGQNIRVIMKWPEGRLMGDEELLKADGVDGLERLIVSCIDKIWQGDTIYDPSTEEPKEVIDFLESLDLKSRSKIKAFLDDVPHLYYKIEYTNNNDAGRLIELTALDDFFLL